MKNPEKKTAEKEQSGRREPQQSRQAGKHIKTPAGGSRLPEKDRPERSGVMPMRNEDTLGNP